MLEGVRVIEVSQLIAAPVCGLTLADYGADVTKVEAPGPGDYTRTLPPVLDNGESAYFHMLNRGKRLVRLDLKSDELRELLLTADVVVENAGEERLPLTYDELRAHNPKVVWCAVTGSGRGRKGRMLDPGLQASMGMMALTGEPDGAPMRLPVPLVDFTTGLYAVQSVLAALLGGQGGLLDCALIDAAATLTSSAGVWAINSDVPLRRMGSQSMWYAPAANLPAADGVYVQFVAINRSHWRALAETLGHPEWLEDLRFIDNDARMANRDALHELMGAAIATQPAEHWEREVIAAGGFCQRVREIEEAWADPLLEQRGLITELDDGLRVPTVSLANSSSRTVVRLAEQE